MASNDQKGGIACEWMDIRALTQYAAISPRTVREWVHRPTNPLPAAQVGGKLLIRRTVFDEWMTKHLVRENASVDAIVNEVMADLRRK